MKLTVLKVLSLLVLLGGVLILGVLFENGFITGYYENALKIAMTGEPLPDATGEVDEGNYKFFLIVSGLLMVGVGFYGFIPKFPARKESITFAGDSGEVTIQLAQVEKGLRRVLNKMDEVKKVQISVKPSADGKQALISAKTTLMKPEGVTARATAERVHRFIEHTAKDMLGLEELAPIALQVDFAVNPKDSGRTLRQVVNAKEAAVPPTVSEPAETAEAPGEVEAPPEESVDAAAEEPLPESPEELAQLDAAPDEGLAETAAAEVSQEPEEEPAAAEEEQTASETVVEEVPAPVEEAVPEDAEAIEEEASEETVVPEEAEGEDENPMPPLAALLGDAVDGGFPQESEAAEAAPEAGEEEALPEAAESTAFEAIEDEDADTEKEEDPEDASGGDKWSF